MKYIVMDFKFLNYQNPDLKLNKKYIIQQKSGQL